MCPVIPCVRSLCGSSFISCGQSLLLAQNFPVLLSVLRELGELLHIACDGWKSCDASRVYNNRRPKNMRMGGTSGVMLSGAWMLPAQPKPKDGVC